MKSKFNIVIVSLIFISISGVFISSCKKKELLTAASIELVSGGGQTAQVETSLTNSIEVIVKDQNGNAFPGTDVSFTVSEGSVSDATATTDVSGKVSVTWILGATAWTQSLTVTAFRADRTTALTGSPLSVTATAEPLAATSIELVSGNNQTAQVLTSLANPVVVIVKDQNGDAFPGTDVSFTVTEGSVSAATVTTNVDGNASVTWTLGETVGIQTLNATVTGLTGSPVMFSATGNQITVTDIDNNTYNAVVIGNQVWMAENLKVTHYPNGDAIQLVTNNTEWGNLADDNTSDAYCYYDNSSANATTYGALYTYAAATNGDNSGNNVQGACPDGWHLPNNAEWDALTIYLGSSAGSKLAGNAGLWQNGDLVNDANFGTSGFSALPGGYRVNGNGNFVLLGHYGNWRSSTETSGASAWYRCLYYYSTTVHSVSSNKSNGFSMRCVRD